MLYKKEKTELTAFSFNNKKVRTLQLDDKPYFVAKDVCEILGLGKYRDAISTLKDYERGSDFVDTLGGKQTMALINESGLYRLMFRSRKPFAEEFTKWVTSEVLPAIRKFGCYIPLKADTDGLFEGLMPIQINGRVLYCYTDVLRKIGFSVKSGSSSKRLKKYANHKFKLFGRNFITVEYAEVLVSEKRLIQSRLGLQLSLVLDDKGGQNNG